MPVSINNTGNKGVGRRFPIRTECKCGETHSNGQSLLIWVNKRHQESGKKCWGRMLKKVLCLRVCGGAGTASTKYIQVAHQHRRSKNAPGRLGADADEVQRETHLESDREIWGVLLVRRMGVPSPPLQSCPISNCEIGP
jgi:hypothetical protein